MCKMQAESYIRMNNIISVGLKCVMSMILIKIGVDLNGTGRALCSMYDVALQCFCMCA